MSRSTHVLLLSVVLAASWAAAGEVIPAEVWQMKGSPGLQNKDAVFVEAKLVLENRWVEQSFRLRVMSEAGKAAAEFALIPTKATEVSGRTVYPDGREVLFQSTKDFQNKTVLSTSKDSVERRLLIPPGLTDDCVVELRFREMADWARPKTSAIGNMRSWALAFEFPTRKFTVEIAKLLPWAWHASYLTSQRVEQSEQGGRRIVVFHDISAAEQAPFVREAERDSPRIHVFEVPEDFSMVARAGGDAYWQAFSDRWVKHWFLDAVSKGGAYQDFLREVSEGLPKEPQAAAAEVLYRLDRRVRNRSYPTFSEEGDRSRPDENGADLKALGDQIKRGFAAPWGMRMIYFNLLKDLGIPVKFLFVADRDRREIDKKQPNFQQFEDVIMAVPEAGKPPLFVDPGMRYSVAGALYPDYQGTNALVIDPATWKASFEKLPVQPKEINREHFVFKVDPLEGEDRFEMEAEFQGLPSLLERHRNLRLDPAAQQKKLKARFEGAGRQIAISKTEVLNVLEPGKTVKWSVRGTKESDGGSLRTVAPFPAHRLPLWFPDPLPKKRVDAIQLPYLVEHSSTSTITIPKGYRFVGVDPLSQQNEFGKVEWNAVPAGDGNVKATMNIEIRTAQATYQDYASLRRFLGWMQQAQGKQIVLEKLQ